MQLDFQQFLMKLEKLTDIRPIPDKEFVETYIKAYYLTENDMEQFIKNHRVRVASDQVLCRCEERLRDFGGGAEGDGAKQDIQSLTPRLLWSCSFQGCKKISYLVI